MDLEIVSGVRVARGTEALRAWVLSCRKDGKSIGFVPTMGALHAGHLSLVAHSQAHTDVTVLSIFVNPLQFRPGEDLQAYPRPFARDCQLAAEAGVDVVFAPSAESVYPQGFQTHVEVENLTTGLCGAVRPGHFRGVTTVVCKLLNLVMADVAVFGEKDWQQLQAIARMARDLDHPTRILGAPIVREMNGLAMSSRNVYLSDQQRQAAGAIFASLQDAQLLAQKGETDVSVLEARVRSSITAAGGRVDYATICHSESLLPLTQLLDPARIIVAAYFGKARLLDNCAL